MAMKANIYKEEDQIGNPELLTQLEEAVIELGKKMEATMPIKKDGLRVGWGVNKAQRGIAADKIISITRVIKSLKGW